MNAMPAFKVNHGQRKYRGGRKQKPETLAVLNTLDVPDGSVEFETYTIALRAANAARNQLRRNGLMDVMVCQRVHKVWCERVAS
jgi:hypothetical protein